MADLAGVNEVAVPPAPAAKAASMQPGDAAPPPPPPLVATTEPLGAVGDGSQRWSLKNWKCATVGAETLDLEGSLGLCRHLPFDDIVGAMPVGRDGVDVVMLEETAASRAQRSAPRIALKKRLVHLECWSEEEAQRLVAAIRHVARRPDVEPTRSRRLLAIVNPHGGKGIATSVWRTRMQPLLEAAGLECDVQPTARAGHAMDMGREYDPARYEGVIAFGGDGTCQEFCAGMCSRPDWSDLLRRTPIATVKLGTNNAVAQGLRTVEPEFAALCIVKRYLRPLDAMVVSNAAGIRTISLCVAGWGMASAVALESESTRQIFGVYRYSYLKGRHALQMAMGQEKFTATVEYSSDVGMSDGELATYFARAGRPERWYKVHNDAAGEEATPAAGAGDFGDDVLRLSPRAVSLYSHSDALAALPANGTRPVPHPRDTMYGMRESDTAGASRPIVNILATTVEVVKAAVEAGAAGRARAASGTAGAAGGEGRPDVAAASPRPFMRTSDGGVLPDTESIRLQTSTASRGSRVGESGTGGGSDTAAGGGGRQGDATDALLHPALSSKVLEPADSVRTVAKAQRALDDDIVHVDDAASIRPPPPAATGTTPPPPGGASGGGDGSCGGGTPAFVTDAVTAANDAAGGDATPASSISEATANAAALWPNGGFGQLVKCSRGCRTCSMRGRLRFVGHRAPADLSMVADATSRAHVTAAVAGAGGEGDEGDDDSVAPPSPATADDLIAHMVEVSKTTADTSSATHCTTLGLSLTSRGYIKRKERGSYVTVVALNLAPEARYGHASDGYVDLFIVRSGTAAAALGLFGRYVGSWTGIADLYGSDLIDYVKVRSLVITPDPGQEDTVLNVDGEAFPGPGPFRMHLMPSLLTMYGTF